MLPYTVRAYNTATESTNKIHDDEVARRYGFAGGLVPGVDVYAYLTHPVAEAWGRAWLERGTIEARFVAPVYDGEKVTVEPTEAGEGAVDLALRNPVGDVCATARAMLPAAAEAPDVSGWPHVPRPEVRHPAEPGVVGGLGTLGSWTGSIPPGYLADVRETLPLYEDGAVVHPGWLLRTANWLLSTNVALGPWIHVASSVRHHRVVLATEAVSARGRVVDEYERKGHRFVELDVAVVVDDTAVAATIHHTAIYRPRLRSGVR